jgi:hypothetical protein
MEVWYMDSYRINTPTNLTVNIRNVGSVSDTLIAYYVKDSAGNQYADSNRDGPIIAPSIIIPINILIDGRAFTFQTGTPYTVSIVISTYDQFTFSIT